MRLKRPIGCKACDETDLSTAPNFGQMNTGHLMIEVELLTVFGCVNAADGEAGPAAGAGVIGTDS